MAKLTFNQVPKSLQKAPGSAEPGLYARDHFAWSVAQAKALRERRFSDLDIDNLAGEIEGLGKSEFGRVENILTVLLLHLLKWDFQPLRRSDNWQAAIGEQRHHVASALIDNPSLESKIDQLMREAYQAARERAGSEPDFPSDRLPETIPYDWKTITEREINLERGRELGQAIHL